MIDERLRNRYIGRERNNKDDRREIEIQIYRQREIEREKIENVWEREERETQTDGQINTEREKRE